MTEPTPRTSRIGGSAMAIGALACVVCCAGPALIAGGALSAIGTTLGSPIVLAAGLDYEHPRHDPVPVTLRRCDGLLVRTQPRRG